MSASKSAWWISVAVVFCLAFLTAPAGVAEVIGAAGEPADAGSGHERPVEPPEAPGFIERLPLTNPNISTMSPTPVSLLPVQDGYWLAVANDLYKLSKHGEVIAHEVFPFSWYDSLLIVDVLIPYREDQIYLLTSDVNSPSAPAVILLMDNGGMVLASWQLPGLPFQSVVAVTDEAIFIDDLRLLILNHYGQSQHYLELSAGICSLSVSSMDQVWAGAYGSYKTIESLLFRLNSDGIVTATFAFRPLVDQDRPEHHGCIQEMVPLPGGGWVVAGLMGYFKESNPWDLRWKYYSYLAEIGADGTVVWAQLFEDLNLVGLKRDAAGGLWGFGNALINGNGIEAQLVIRFTTTGEPLWAVERRETYYFDDIRSGQTAVTPEGGLALAWTTQFYKELWFGVLDPSRPLEGCDTFRSFDLTGRWLGPVTIETRPAEVQAVELDPVAIWEEPIELWEGEGEIIEWCPLRPLTRRGVRLSPLIR